jgi:predicted ATPase/DNA-binding CsgD family transcriptional regulator
MTPAGALRSYLADRDVLLVLDNCERVVDACAELAAGLLSSCGYVRILATSRELLAVSGETAWRVDPLAPADAQRLFVARARQRQPGFIPSEVAEATIDRICARLDGLPLAIELAAGRVGVLSLEEILAGVETRLGELTGGERLAPRHHRTLRASVEWSYQLLDSDEREAFRSLAVFVGGFDAEAARSVAIGLSLDLLARLVDKSLVAVEESTAGRTRYRLLDTVHEYAREALMGGGGLDAARERHLRHFARIADAAPRDGWPSSGAVGFVNELHDDYENVRTALEWAAAADPCAARSLFTGMKDVFLMLGEADGRRLSRLLLERCAARDRERAEVQITAGMLTLLVDAQTARTALAEASTLSAEIEERALEGWALVFLGLTETLAGAIEPAREHLGTGRAQLAGLGVPRGWAIATAALGLTYVMTDEPLQAKQLVEDALAVNVAADDDWGQGQCQIYLGIIAESTATDPARATVHYRKAVEHLRPFRGGPLLPVALVWQAGVLEHRDPAKALRVAAAAHALRAQTGGDFAPFFRARADQVKAAAEARVGAQAVQTWKEGARLTLDEAITLAFGPARPRHRAAAGLSERETEIARLVAHGLSNKAIAASLHLSVRTVESHVRHALAKVGLENRTQLANWAREHIQ